jgi:hypothetical protein
MPRTIWSENAVFIRRPDAPTLRTAGTAGMMKKLSSAAASPGTPFQCTRQRQMKKLSFEEA